MTTPSTSPSPAAPPPLATAPCAAARLVAALDRWQWWIAFLFLAIGAIDQGIHNTRPGIDFAVFVRAARRLLAGEDLYRLSDGHFAYKYLPAAALVFAPFAHLPERLGWALWDLLAAASIARVMRISAAARAPAPGALGHLLVLLLFMPFYTRLFFLGQCDALLVLLAVESEARARRQPVLSGALVALAIGFKMPFAILVVFAALQRQWRRVACAAVGVGALLALPALWYGAAGAVAQLEAWRALLAATTPGLLCDSQNYSAFAVVCRYVPPSAGASFTVAVVAVTSACTLVVVLAAWSIGRKDRPLGGFVLLAGGLWLAAFASPLGWRTNLLGLIPLLYLALALARGAASVGVRLAAAGALALQFVDAQFAHRVAPGLLAAHRDVALVAAALALVTVTGLAMDVARGRAARAPAGAEGSS